MALVLFPGTNLKGLNGRYTIESQLGGGGEGMVYLAKDNHDKLVSVKVYNKPDPARLAQEKRFWETLSATARLPGCDQAVRHIAALLDMGEDKKAAFLVFEYLSRSSLEQVLTTHHAQPISSVFFWARKIAKGLAFCHRVGYVHRDVKPANILFCNPDSYVKLVDFGLVAAIGANDARPGGSIGYASPQQCQGLTPSPSDDVFSLGATIFEALTGRRPFDSGDQDAELRAVLDSQLPAPPLPSTRGLPEALCSLVAAMLSKSAASRPFMRAVNETLHSLSS